MKTATRLARIREKWVARDAPQAMTEGGWDLLVDNYLKEAFGLQ